MSDVEILKIDLLKEDGETYLKILGGQLWGTPAQKNMMMKMNY